MSRFNQDKPFKPDTSELFGPGIDYWNTVREDNHHPRVVEKDLRIRSAERGDFSNGIKRVVAAIEAGERDIID